MRMHVYIIIMSVHVCVCYDVWCLYNCMVMLSVVGLASLINAAFFPTSSPVLFPIWFSSVFSFAKPLLSSMEVPSGCSCPLALEHWHGLVSRFKSLAQQIGPARQKCLQSVHAQAHSMQACVPLNQGRLSWRADFSNNVWEDILGVIALPDIWWKLPMSKLHPLESRCHGKDKTCCCLVFMFF